MIDRPLHVQVAEALGCRPLDFHGIEWQCTCEDHRHAGRGTDYMDGTGPLFDYDTDWSATGPTIERLFGDGFVLSIFGGKSYAGYHVYMSDTPERLQEGATPLEAVCNLILALREAGKLPK